MTESELDVVYTQLCKTMTGLGEAQALLFLARFAMLAIVNIDNAEQSLQLIKEASDGMNDD